MKVWKLVAGILSIVFNFFVTFQSCAAGLYNALSENGESSGTAGVFVAIFMMVGGIVSIVSRKTKGKGGNIALIILFGLGALLGYTNSGNFADLAIWGTWCAINVITAIVALCTTKKEVPEVTEETKEQ